MGLQPLLGRRLWTCVSGKKQIGEHCLSPRYIGLRMLCTRRCDPCHGKILLIKTRSARSAANPSTSLTFPTEWQVATCLSWYALRRTVPRSLLFSMSRMQEQFHENNPGLKTSADSIATATQGIAAGNQDLSQRTE